MIFFHGFAAGCGFIAGIHDAFSGYWLWLSFDLLLMFINVAYGVRAMRRQA